ncbi:MAG TPA: AbrB/MazE/SpoVT family DNA-binding domain-containing protein [Clostridia bacterium]|nr:AbrB/MazE/SpoVT family DNA-binding domain-containing protein [Clostridia bacterium]
MADNGKVIVEGCSCLPLNENRGSCCVEAIISMDDRGQIVIPKNIRDKLGLTSSEKLVLISWTKSNKVESVSIMRNDVFSEIINNYYNSNRGVE